MPSSISTDQAYATAPTSPSGGEKGSMSRGIGSKAGGREGGLAVAGAPAIDSHSSPTSGTPLEDRSSSPSPFDSFAAGRKRKKVYYGKTDESDLSELSQKEEESSGEESEGYTGSEEQDGEEDDEEAGSDGSSEGETASSRTMRDFSGPSTVLWPAVATQALERGLPLMPCLGKRNLKVGSKRMGRNGLLAEYVRRQTGLVYNRIQINARLKTLKRRAKGDENRLKLIKGDVLDYQAIAGRDWSAHLGPDLHPSSKRSKECSKSALTQQKKKAKRVKREPKTPSSSTFHTLNAPALPPSPAYLPHPPTYYQPYSNPPYHPQLPPTYSAPQPPPFPPQLAQPSSSSPLLAVSSRHVPPQAPPPTPLSSLDLSAFLSSFSPSHDFSRASSALLSAGLTSLEDLASLLSFGNWTFEAFLQQALSGLDETERATVKVVLERARRKFVSG